MLSRGLVAVLDVAVVAECVQTTQTPRTERADIPDRPIDCTAAAGDIAAPEIASPGAAERAAAGVRVGVPFADIAGRVHEKLERRREIASGRTEDKLRARIAEIEAACPSTDPSRPVVGG